MPREDESKKAEQEINKIRKLPENKLCANCQAPGTPLLTAVVMPFRIFVCSTCKSAHQSFSHRCKSTQMSLWTMDEVRTLEDRNGGGNRAAQERWLAHVRDGDRPKEGDRLERFKDFVQRAYIEERWKGEGGGGGGGSGRGRREESPEPPRSTRQAKETRGSNTQVAAPARRGAQPAAATQPDLFDLEATAPAPASVDLFGAFSSASNGNAGAATGASAFDSFDPNGFGSAPQEAGGFGQFVSASAAPPAQLQQPWAGPGMAAPVAAPAPAAMPFNPSMAPGPATGTGAAPVDLFDPFASAPAPQANLPAPVAPMPVASSPVAPSGGEGFGQFVSAGASPAFAGGPVGQSQPQGLWAPQAPMQHPGNAGPSPNQRYAALQGGGGFAPTAGMGGFGTPWPQGQQNQMSPFALQQHQQQQVAPTNAWGNQMAMPMQGQAPLGPNGNPNAWGPGAVQMQGQAPLGTAAAQQAKQGPGNIQDLQQSLQQLYARA